MGMDFRENRGRGGALRGEVHPHLLGQRMVWMNKARDVLVVRAMGIAEELEDL
jgi:hypothetical protein